jgi:hypothetical protein
MLLLRDLLREEFELLVARDTDAVVHLEFSVHELLRQLAAEKRLIIRLLNREKARAYAMRLPEKKGAPLLAVLRELDELEQACARNAAQNADLSLSLLDQSRLLLSTVHERLGFGTGDTYGRRGAMRSIRRPEAALLAGRL